MPSSGLCERFWNCRCCDSRHSARTVRRGRLSQRWPRRSPNYNASPIVSALSNGVPGDDGRSLDAGVNAQSFRYFAQFCRRLRRSRRKRGARAEHNPKGSKTMSKDVMNRPVRRRALLKAGLAISAIQVASPFILTARGETPIKIGVDEPLTGTYAVPGKNEVLGCQLAVDQLNAKNGILGRKIEMLTEDSTSGDAGM